MIISNITYFVRLLNVYSKSSFSPKIFIATSYHHKIFNKNASYKIFKLKLIVIDKSYEAPSKVNTS